MRRFVIWGTILVVVILAATVISIDGSAQTYSQERYTWSYIISSTPVQAPQYPNIGVGSDGKIWIAYIDGTSTKYVNITWYDGSTWNYRIIDKVNFTMVGHGAGASPIALCMENNIPHVFYYTQTNHGLDGYLNHTYLNGNTWITESVWHGSLIDNTGKPENSISAIYYDGTIYILFQIMGVNYLSSPENGLFLIYGNSGSWSTPKQIVLKNSYHWFFGDLAVYSSNKIGIVFSEEFADVSSGEKVYYIQYVEYDGTSFSSIENLTSDTNDYIAKITFDSSGNPHIYKGVSINSIGNTYLKEWYQDSTGSWKTAYVDTDSNNPNGPLNTQRAPNGNLVLAYNKDGQTGIQFAENSGGIWSFDSLNDPLSGNAGGKYPSISFDSSGNIYVAYVNWNAEKADTYHIVVATTNTVVPEFSNFIIVIPILIIAAAIYIKKR